MFYYKVDGNKIFKYEVSYDLEIVKYQKDLEAFASRSS